MKQTVKKLLFMLGIMCLTIFGKETSTTVLADNLDEIENYTIYAEPDWEDGSVYLKYDITWKVLDSDTDGPLEWVKIGIPNSNVEEIEGYSSNIENIRYYKNGGSYVRIDFDRKYYEGETVEFSFGIHQHHLYQTIDGMRVYRFTPGWFDEIVVDELNIYWKSDNIKYVLNGYWEQDGYYQFRTSLAEGEKYTVKIEYDADVFQTEDDKKISHPVGTGTKIVMAVMLLVVPGILLLLIIRAYKKGISSTLIFEGWDAAGKGGAIRRLTAGTDARITRVIPISAPSDEELAHHYLWRFWRHIPRAGFITIYDRSWYGRVLVERVEKLTPKEDWARAYAEINHFEHQLTNNGNILLKFWLHISPEEQLRRFREREAIPWKRYKITDEDWRNRDKWPEYARAADEMFLRTSTEDAPWHVVPAENKKYARLMVLRIYRDALKRALR